MPRLTLNVDEGLGLGARGTLYLRDAQHRPYKAALSFQGWVTTRLVQHHFLRADVLDAFDLPLRLEAEGGFFTTLTQPYCGLVDGVCPDDATHRMRSTEPYASVQARVRLKRAPVKVELFGTWRGTNYIPGTLFSDDDGDGAPDLFPTPDTLYARDHPGGEPGFASVLQAGIVLDTRDDEPDPTHGFLVDASVRGSHPAWGSAWTFGAATVGARLYVPLVPDRSVVLAQRVFAEVVHGDAPVRERMRTGGLVDSVGAIGGQDLGRGIRLARYPGRSRVVHQAEVRWDVLHLDVWGNDCDWVLAGFVDDGIATFDATLDGTTTARDGKRSLPRMLWGAGASTRVVWNQNFVMRLDVALSPEEPGRVAVYSAPGHPY